MQTLYIGSKMIELPPGSKLHRFLGMVSYNNPREIEDTDEMKLYLYVKYDAASGETNYFKNVIITLADVRALYPDIVYCYERRKHKDFNNFIDSKRIYDFTEKINSLNDSAKSARVKK